MPNHRLYQSIIGILCLFILGGCASHTAPKAWLPSAEQSQTEAYGGWIELYYKSENNQTYFIDGELFALSSDSLYLFSEKQLYSIHKKNINKAQIVYFKSNDDAMFSLTLLGSLTTLSHGYFAVITAPVLWWIPGSAATSIQSRRAIITFPRYPIEAFQLYCRFPQGLPEFYR